MDETADMADTAASDSEKQSRRDRWKDAISRTKSKFNKKEKEAIPERDQFQLSEDVNDFLAAGRKAPVTATIRSVPEPPRTQDPSPRPSTSESINSSSSNNNNRLSPRGPYVPKLDITQSQRWPNARPVEMDPRSRSDDHLTPNYNDRHTQNERSHSLNSALAKKRTRSRGLSVSFTTSPPIIIGIGGDKAEAPTFEISRAKNRSRSLSPYLDRPASNHSNSSEGRSPVRRKPVPSPSPSPTFQNNNTEREDSIFQPKPMRRVQTGWNGQELQTPFVSKTLEEEFQDGLRLKEQLRHKNPFADSLLQQSEAPVSHPARYPSLHRLAIPQTHMAGPQPNQHLFNQSVNEQNPRPFLDSNRVEPPTPKVRNFYADLKGSDSGRGVEPSNDRDNYMEHVSTSLKRQPTFPHNQDVAELPKNSPRRGHGPQDQPPPGWI